MNNDVMLWAAFWVSMGLLPCIVAVRRLLSMRRFRSLSKWILRTGLAQILMPVAVICIEQFGILPFKGKWALGVALVFWVTNFIAMWLVFIGLGLACLLRPRHNETYAEPVGEVRRHASVASVMLGFVILIAGTLALLYSLAMAPGWMNGRFAIAFGMIALGTKLVLRVLR